MTMTSSCWVVGSAADPECTKPADIDIVVPFSEWRSVSSHIPSDARPNKLGGWRFTSEGVEVDVWPYDLSMLFAEGILKYAYCPKTGVRVQTYGSR